MMTSIDFVNIVYGILAQSPIQISGALYKLKRPRATDKEDIVVMPLMMQSVDQVTQMGIMNINIHFPNIDPDGSGNTYADTERMATLSTQVVDLIHLQTADNYLLTVQQQKVFQEENLDESFVNIRVQALLINS